MSSIVTEVETGERNGHGLKKVKPSTLDFKGQNHPQEVIEAAEAIFQKYFSKDTYRSANRKAVNYFCLYKAYIEKQISFDRFALGSSLGLNKGKVSYAITFGGKIAGSIKEHSTPEEYIPIHSNKLKLSIDMVGEMIDFSREIVRRQPAFAEMLPQNVAAGIIYYYCQIKGITFNNFAEDLGGHITEAIIIAISKQVAAVDNQM